MSDAAPTLRFTKMQGCGNDFVVLDGISQAVNLTAQQVRRLADRRFGVGCDQVLVVERPRRADADFRYRIFNADGGEVEQCGNGARCFVKFVRDHGLSGKRAIRVETASGVIEPSLDDDDEVTVDMGVPRFAPDAIPFVADAPTIVTPIDVDGVRVEVSVLSMGNPHAVQVVDRANIRLRVWERGAGETLACGTGACAAVVAGVRRGMLDSVVRVHTHGGTLTVAWAGGDQPVRMTGPAETSFEGEYAVPASS